MKNISILLFLLLMPYMVSAENVVEIDGIYYNLISKGNVAEVTVNPSKYKDSIDIPATITYEGIDYDVTSIGEKAFESCSELRAVTIPASVTTIRSYAFRNSGLTSIVIPSSVHSVEKYAFFECHNLENAIISNRLKSIDFYVFGRCGLTSVTIPESVTSIENSAFFYCSRLDSITIPGSVTTIGGQAFKGCSSLSSLKFEEGLSRIQSYAFKDCTSLDSVSFPNSLQVIGSEAFAGCSLKEIIIGEEISTISENAFGSCSNITTVYCLARSAPSTSSNAFANSYIEFATLFVPTASVDSYNSNEPWMHFKEIVPINDIYIEKCATPTIAIVNNRLTFSCETEGVEFAYEITNADAKKGSASEVLLGGSYTVNVYAKKDGYENSDTATLEFTLGTDGEVCDVNKDGTVDVADIATIIKSIQK